LAGAAALAAAAPSLAGPALDLRTIERRRVLENGAKALKERPLTVTAFPSPRSPGRPNDYYSEADYWWPDPANPGGLPYIRRDGYSNPDKFVGHREALIRLSVIVPALAAAWLLTSEARYARHAEAHLAAWFANPDTRMNPHLEHAQAILGVNTGRGIGIIDTLHLVEVARAVQRLRDGGVSARTDAAVTRWFGEYLRWMTTSEKGLDERDEENNHGTCWALQAAEFARLTGDESLRKELRGRFRTLLVPQQIAPDGAQPRELRRTKPYSYSLFNLDVFAALAQTLSTSADDLWRFETDDGRSLRKAVAFMYPFTADKTAWPYAKDVEHFDDLPVRQPNLLFAGLAYSEPRYLELWRRLPADPSVGEIIRNHPVRQPILWLG
jgi:hypothetical protein